MVCPHAYDFDDKIAAVPDSLWDDTSIKDHVQARSSTRPRGGARATRLNGGGEGDERKTGGAEDWPRQMQTAEPTLLGDELLAEAGDVTLVETLGLHARRIDDADTDNERENRAPIQAKRRRGVSVQRKGSLVQLFTVVIGLSGMAVPSVSCEQREHSPQSVAKECRKYVSLYYVGECPDTEEIVDSDIKELDGVCCPGSSTHCHYNSKTRTDRITLFCYYAPVSVAEGFHAILGKNLAGYPTMDIKPCPEGTYQPKKLMSNDFHSFICKHKRPPREGMELLCSGGLISEDRYVCSRGYQPFSSDFCFKASGFAVGNCRCVPLQCPERESPFRSETAPATLCSDSDYKVKQSQVQYKCVRDGTPAHGPSSLADSGLAKPTSSNPSENNPTANGGGTLSGQIARIVYGFVISSFLGFCFTFGW